MYFKDVVLKYKKYDYSPILGWSISRYELFDKCKRQYYYNYYAKHVSDVPLYKIKKLKELTSIPLEIGNVVHDVLEAYLRRLQKDAGAIDESRFLAYAREKTAYAFSHKAFMETHYGTLDSIDIQPVHDRVATCLKNYLESPVCSWVFMKALTNKHNWLIEPEGYGETRLNGLKAYCKMDFLFPVDGHIHILDWKTGKKNTYKHFRQLIGYATAAEHNFGIPWNVIFPKIIYLHPDFDELELRITENDLSAFFSDVRAQTDEMKSYCIDPEQNIPQPIDSFPKSPSNGTCGYCNYRELCFPGESWKSDGPVFDPQQ